MKKAVKAIRKRLPIRKKEPGLDFDVFEKKCPWTIEEVLGK